MDEARGPDGILERLIVDLTYGINLKVPLSQNS